MKTNATITDIINLNDGKKCITISLPIVINADNVNNVITNFEFIMMNVEKTINNCLLKTE
jgi:hypothetical protein